MQNEISEGHGVEYYAYYASHDEMFRFTNFRFDTSPVTLSLTNESLSPLQASEWSSLGIFWIHSAIIRGIKLGRMDWTWVVDLKLCFFAFLFANYTTMTTPKASSVINPDIPPPPRSNTSAPSGDRPLSPSNDAGAPNKRSRTVSEDAMNLDTTSPSAPAPNLISSVPSGASQTVDASIHAPSGAKGKDKAVDFSNSTRAPSPDASKASVQSSSSRYHAAAYLRDAPDAFKSKIYHQPYYVQ
ncbi:unnamed protein product [Rhizophagus irregularis]|nr:unnamed protein product [Rhizophagus irregularis]